MQELTLTMLGGFYQFERSMMLERQRIIIAKMKGKPDNIELNKNIHTFANVGTNKSQIAKLFLYNCL